MLTVVVGNVNYLWLNSSWYAFMSSEWGGIVVKAVGLVLLGFVGKWLHRKVHAHLECHVESCNNWGHVVAGPNGPTSYRACKEHSPHHEQPITAEHIANVAKDGHNIHL